MKKGFSVFSILIVLLFFYSCGKKGPETGDQSEQPGQEKTIESKEESEDTGEKYPMAVVNELTKQMKEQSEKQAGGKITVADETTLKTVLRPVSGWDIQEPSYSKSSIGNLTVSDLETEYTMDGKTITIKISDAGTAQSVLTPVKMAISMNISHEDDEGFQKIFEYKGHNGIEEYNKLDDFSEVTLIYKDRYIVSLRSESGLTTKDLKDFLDKLDLSKLE